MFSHPTYFTLSRNLYDATILGELSICVSEGHYNWHGALQDEQRSRAPLSLTIYPLLTEAANISFEASSSLIIGKHMEEEGAEIVETGQTPLATTAQVCLSRSIKPNRHSTRIRIISFMYYTKYST